MSEDLSQRSNTVIIEEVNLEYLKSISDDDIEFMQDMIRTFITEMPESLKFLNNYYDTSDWKSVASVAHHIKPSLQIMGLNNTYELIKEIELSGKNNEKGNIPKLLTQLIPTIEKAVSALQVELQKL